VKQLIILLLLVSFTTAQGQKLPDQWNFSEENHILSSGEILSTDLYDESKLEDIRLYFSQPNFWTLLTQNYNSKTDLSARLVYQGENYDSVGIRFKGQTSYFMNNTQKKSFNISMDYVKDNQKLSSFKTLNLNNSWQDPSFMREVLYYRLIRKHSPAAKANFVKLYINDEYWGVYQNLQQLNKDFLEEWYESNDGINFRADVPDGTTGTPGPGGGGMWGDGTAALNYLGSDTSLYQKYYTLKSSDQPDPWTELVKACEILNATPVANLENVAPFFFDIDKILWHLACEIAFSDDDSYVYKGKMDYYLYQDAETKRFSTYDYDANSTMKTQNINWSPFYNAQKVNYPLLNKLLAVPAYRQRYLAHMRTIINELFDENKVNTLIDQYDSLIRTSVQSDTKKPTSNNAYINELTVLKNFIKNRKTNLLANNEVKAPSPTITEVYYHNGTMKWGKISAGSEAIIHAAVSFTAGIQKVNLYYSEGFSGLFFPVEMYDSGTDGDLIANDGVFTYKTEAFKGGTLVRFYVEAIGNDSVKSRSYYPAGAEHQLLYYIVEPVTVDNTSIVINEFMATNTGIVKDEFGENEDWIELYNTTNQAIDMSGFYISDKTDNPTKFKFAEGTIIEGNGFLIVWADEDGSQGPLHANFKLSLDGESIILSNKNLEILDNVTFGPQVTNKSSARIPNGTGPFIIGDHSFNANNDDTSTTYDYSESSFTFYPNPATESIKVKSVESGNFEIINLTGEKVSGFSINNEEIRVSVLEMAAGIYIIRSGQTSKKLILIK
jgi:hypothetical protein